MKAFESLFLATTLILGAAVAHADTTVPQPRPAHPTAARTVTLWYPAPDGAVFYNEVTVEESVPGSYFEVCGFGGGYTGIQELRDGKKVVIFSIWDSRTTDDPNAVKPGDQVEVLSQGEGVDVKRFGGEGTGQQSFWKYDWKVGVTYKFCVSSKIEGDKTTYSDYFFVPEQNRWQLIATLRAKTGGAPLKGLYSFVEDFRRDGNSPDQIRRARYSNGWLKSTTGDWVSLRRALFAADNNPHPQFNAGVSGDSFFVQNGGTTIETSPLGTIFERPMAGMTLPDLTEK